MDFRLQTPVNGKAGSEGIANGAGIVRRSQFAVLVVLAPMNGTFDKKSLVVPFGPDVLKLGRQTTQRSVASPENGFFDSRVLSRQHAELWADQDSGKVWLKDCKSSNGTYINKQRLSGENAESEPFELKKGDLLDLGIDIASDDNALLIYRKISARVERIAMIPLQSINATFIGTSNGSASGSHSASSNGGLEKPQLSRNPSLATLRSNGPDRDADTELTSAIFGSNPLEALALSHVQTPGGLGGMLIKDDIKTQVDFELAARSLVSQIRTVRVDTAKVRTVLTLLEQLKALARKRTEAESGQKEAKEVSIAALRAEIDRLRAENAELTALVHDLNKRPQREGGAITTQQKKRKSELVFKPPKVHSLVLLLVTTFIVTVTGVSIMIFFNPPSMPPPPALSTEL